MNFENIFKENLPKLYHATLKRFIPSIKKLGLGGKLPKRRFWDYKNTPYENITQGVFLATDDDIAWDYLESCDELYDRYEDFEPDDDIVVFEIDINDLDLSKLSIDENNSDEECPTYFYNGIISFEKLKRVRN
jgi:hypothetical protein